MSKRSEGVKKWRKACKDRVVAAMGGQCCVCGYNKCHASLVLHHLDPSQKDFTLGAIRASSISWIRIVEELRKCVLLCQNCHNEFHAGVTQIPDDAPRFNELYADYKKLESIAERDNCPVCGALKLVHKITCSRSCAGKHVVFVNWELVDLAKEFKNKSVPEIAEQLGCSDEQVYIRLQKLGLKEAWASKRKT